VLFDFAFLITVQIVGLDGSGRREAVVVGKVATLQFANPNACVLSGW
jgi:hypothetical protein